MRFLMPSPHAQSTEYPRVSTFADASFRSFDVAVSLTTSAIDGRQNAITVTPDSARAHQRLRSVSQSPVREFLRRRFTTADKYYRLHTSRHFT